MLSTKRKAGTYLVLLCFTGHIASSVAAPYHQTAAVAKVQQYIVYPMSHGETLKEVAEHFSVSMGTLTALDEHFKAYGWATRSNGFVLVPYSSTGEMRLYNNYIPYQLKAHESIEAVAGKFNRSAHELTTLNAQVMSVATLSTLKPGDYILVPGPVAAVSEMTAKDRQESEKTQDKVSQQLVSAAQVLGANTTRDSVNPSDMLAQRLAGDASSEVSERIQKFLSAEGTAKVGVQANVDSGQTNYSIDYLQPLHKTDKDLFFGQVGARTFGDRNLADVGVGYRHQVNEHLVVGANAFIDQDLTDDNTRGGLGAEVWTDKMRFSSNYYTPFSGWKNARSDRLNTDPENHILQERAAQGWDLNVEAGVPGVEQLAVTGKYFEWNGSRVDVEGNGSQTENNPKGYTLGGKYQPIPLLNLSASDTHATGGVGGWEFGVGLTWEFGKSLHDMLDPQRATALRPLEQAKTDIVNRNYNVVLEYKEKDRYAPLTFALPNVNMMVSTSTTGQTVQGGRGNTRYTSSNPDMLNVSADGLLLNALVLGTVTVTATDYDSKGKAQGSASYTVTITPNTQAPSVDVTDITGALNIGATLTGVYTFAANGGNTVDKSTITWRNGGHTDTDINYLIDSGDVGKVLTFEVVAKNGIDLVGNTASIDTARAHGVVGGGGNGTVGTAAPKVTILDTSGNELTGPPVIGVLLKVVLICTTACSNSSFDFQWQVETAPGSNTYVDIPGATSDSFTPTIDQQLKKLRVIVETK